MTYLVANSLRDMRFGLSVPQGSGFELVGIPAAEQWDAIRDLAQAADAGPFDSIWVDDHFVTYPPSAESVFEVWSMMAAFAVCTSRVRLGQLCTCVGYRNPAYLAKMAAGIDVMSGGRLQVGVGAGWFEHEWRAFGYGFPSTADRLGMLDEGVQIMRQMWTTGTATLMGKHYQVDGASCRPLPAQEGGIPLWVGGGGEKKTLRIAAKYAQYSHFGVLLDEFAHKSKVLAEHCKDVGTDFDAIVRSITLNVAIGETEKDVADKVAWTRAHYEPLLRAEELELLMRYSAPNLVGTPEQIVERLAKAGKSGLGYLIVRFVDAAFDRTSIDLFANKVIPELA
ncbi:F420-dependent oxidoreductase-like protein [Micromonospora profundi]|uniref:LLM class F420-dependent oxidoreductase n=1 Tax=Micromonospora profundi TaxID=1420889 RepID=UPI0016AFFAFD|nr:LLM class F420-dependent oxidoreductase [Micromonospora profundi]NJC11444.1 F420-dependent oxidoreductase-like protein [Micromonospora profundi]